MDRMQVDVMRLPALGGQAGVSSLFWRKNELTPVRQTPVAHGSCKAKQTLEKRISALEVEVAGGRFAVGTNGPHDRIDSNANL